MRMRPRYVQSWLIAFMSMVLVSSVSLPAGAVELHGFVEPSYGVRYSKDGPIEDRNALLETRAILEGQWYGKRGESLNLRVLANQAHNRDGDVDVREGSIFVPLSPSWELTAGRQIMSWAPAQYEFINDRFAKDYKSFFIGRDLEFLKAPNDAVKLSRFGDIVNANLVLVPQFDPDRTPTGLDVPVYHPGQRQLVDTDSAPTGMRPADSPDEGEVHLRLYKTMGRWEVAAYGYRGFTGTPVGWMNNRTFHPEMSSGGFSARGPLKGAIVWLEGGYDHIRHDLSGDTTGVPPDRGHLLVGGRYRTGPRVNYMLQATWARQFDGDVYRDLLSTDHPDSDRDRFRFQAATTRTYWEDRLEVELRGFLGTTEEDWHVRATTAYEWSDAVNITLGTYHYGAAHSASRFGAMDDHDLFLTRLRYSF
ncbi:MAG: hypothetical protein ABEK50_10480 [bacterium]